MKIERITTNGVDMLYSYALSGHTNGKHVLLFGDNFQNVLNHVNISLVLHDVSAIELYFLKMFVGNNLTYLSSRIDVGLILNDKTPFAEKTHKAMVHCMMSSKEISNADGYFAPAYSLMTNVSIMLTGQSLNLIFGEAQGSHIGIIKFFVDFIHPKDFNEMPERIDDVDGLNNFIIQSFLQSFYKKISDKLTVIDILSDSVIKSEFYDYYSPDEPVMINSVFTPCGSINFIGEKSNTIADDVVKCQDIKRLMSDSTDQLNNIRINIGVVSSFYMFLMLHTIINNEYFSDIMDIRILLNSRAFIIPEHLIKNYGMRLNTSGEKFNELIADANKNDAMKITKFNYIPLNKQIVYSLTLTLSDIDNVIRLIDSKILDDNSLVSLEIKEFKTSLVSKAMSIYHTILK